MGARPWRLWPNTLGWLGQTDAFDEDTHAMLARSRLEHMRYLLAYCGGPNNWYQVECSGLAAAALYSPDLRQSEAVLRVALRRLKWINSFAYYDDGFQFELTHGYHMFPTHAIFGVVRAAKARGVSLPADFTGLVQKAHEMYLYAVQPDGLLPAFNDCNPNPMDPAPTLRSAAEVFERDDLRWGGTYGKEGTPPEHTSHAWHSAGLYAMRDRWGADGQFLFFDGAPWGASHQHEDKLTFTLYAHGRLLLGDPNIYSYANTAITHYFKSSRAHNLIMIDGMGQARRFDLQARLKTSGRNEWVSRAGFDFVSSEYNEGYAPDPFPIARRGRPGRPAFQPAAGDFLRQTGLLDPVRPDRRPARRGAYPGAVVPLCPAGATRMPPCRWKPANWKFRRRWRARPTPGWATWRWYRSTRTGLQARAVKGQTNPAAGWYGILGEYPAWDATFERRSVLPARMDAVLFPQPPGSRSYRWCSACAPTSRSAPSPSAARISTICSSCAKKTQARWKWMA